MVIFVVGSCDKGFVKNHQANLPDFHMTAHWYMTLTVLGNSLLIEFFHEYKMLDLWTSGLVNQALYHCAIRTMLESWRLSNPKTVILY